jgi:hypothetical protein
VLFPPFLFLALLCGWLLQVLNQSISILALLLKQPTPLNKSELLRNFCTHLTQLYDDSEEESEEEPKEVSEVSEEESEAVSEVSMETESSVELESTLTQSQIDLIQSIQSITAFHRHLSISLSIYD